jgi:hypothetical protein
MMGFADGTYPAHSARRHQPALPPLERRYQLTMPPGLSLEHR